MRNSIIDNRWYGALGIGMVLLIWQLLSMNYSSILVPSPAEALNALWGITQSGELSANFLISLKRQLTGLILGLIIGTATGLVSGICRPVQYTMQPLVNILMAVPAVVFAVMGMVWFGMGTYMAVFLVALLVFPVMHTNTVQGIHSIDRSLLEMAEVFRVPAGVKIRRIYLPGFSYSFLAGFSISVATSVRLTVMAELLGATEGMGQAIAISRAYLETEKLFAWVIVLVIIVIGLESLVFKPLHRYTTRWQDRPADSR